MQLIGKTSRELNLLCRNGGLVGVIRDPDGNKHQTRIIRVRFKEGIREGLVLYSGKWAELVEIWEA